MMSGIGGFIKRLSVILGVVLIIVSIITAFVMFGKANDSYLTKDMYTTYGIVFLAPFPLLTAFLMILCYGFGTLVENSDTMVSKVYTIHNELESIKKVVQSAVGEEAAPAKSVSVKPEVTHKVYGVPVSELKNLQSK